MQNTIFDKPTLSTQS